MNKIRLEGLPRTFRFIRCLEEFEAPILCELHAQDGGIFVEKWCHYDNQISTSIIVRSEQRAVAEYLGGRLSMLRLLTGFSDGSCLLVEKDLECTKSVHIVALRELPPGYLPEATVMHDRDLRPEWASVPENFLVTESWDAKLFAVIERIYKVPFAFATLMSHDSTRRIPRNIFGYIYDGGYSFWQAFNKLVDSIPDGQMARSVGVSAHSPGVLTIDAPSGGAERLARVTRDLPKIAPLYKAVHEWGRGKNLRAEKIELPESALDQLMALCHGLEVDIEKLTQAEPGKAMTPKDICVAGVLACSYYRSLVRLCRPAHSFEYLNNALTAKRARTLGNVDDDEDDGV